MITKKLVKRQVRNKVTGKTTTYKSKMGWRSIGRRRIYFRSAWEVEVALYLDWQLERKQISFWEHEPYTFWFNEIKRGTRSYLPDFKVTRLDGSHYWIEVKGYMDRKSITKIKRMKKYYPNEELYIIDKDWFQNQKTIISKEKEKK